MKGAEEEFTVTHCKSKCSKKREGRDLESGFKACLKFSQGGEFKAGSAPALPLFACLFGFLLAVTMW